MNSKKILITGGAGFVGSQLGRRLHDSGHEVVLLDNMSFGHLDNLVINNELFGKFVVCDVRQNVHSPLESSSLARQMEGVDTVFHLAGIAALPVCQSNPGMAYDINTAAVAHVLETARRAGVRRIIFSSTSAVYENNAEPYLSEDLKVEPDLVYASTKFDAEHICKSFSKNYNMDILVARFFNLYGPHQDIKRVSPPLTSYIARELSAGRAPRLFNKSAVQRDYVYVDDVIDLLLLMMQKTRTYRSDIFNIGSGQGYSVPDIYELMCKISGKNISPIYGDPESYWDSYTELFTSPFSMNRARISKEVFKSAIADTSKTFTEFEWRAKTSLEEGLSRVYKFAIKGI